MYGDKFKWEERYQTQHDGPSDLASPFLAKWSSYLRSPVLDLAGGRGRNALFLARQGIEVHVIDIAHNALVPLLRVARLERLPVFAIEADLDSFPLPQRYYRGIVVFRFLQRALFDSIRKAVQPGGVVIYETFLKGQETVGSPKNPEHLLNPGELRQWFQDFEILFYEEGLLERSPPAYLARLVARNPETKAQCSAACVRNRI